MKSELRAAATALGVMAGTLSCGGGGGGGSYGGNAPTSPTPAPGVPTAATITLGGGGASPQQVRINVGQQVMFVNNDAVTHEMRSDPHPTHDACPPLNDVGRLAPGARAATGVLSREGTCGFHDNLNDGDARFRGRILVGVDDPGPTPDYFAPPD